MNNFNIFWNPANYCQLWERVPVSNGLGRVEMGSECLWVKPPVPSPVGHHALSEPEPELLHTVTTLYVSRLGSRPLSQCLVSTLQPNTQHHQGLVTVVSEMESIRREKQCVELLKLSFYGSFSRFLPNLSPFQSRYRSISNVRQSVSKLVSHHYSLASLYSP